VIFIGQSLSIIDSKNCIFQTPSWRDSNYVNLARIELTALYDSVSCHNIRILLKKKASEKRQKKYYLAAKPWTWACLLRAWDESDVFSVFKGMEKKEAGGKANNEDLMMAQQTCIVQAAPRSSPVEYSIARRRPKFVPSKLFCLRDDGKLHCESRIGGNADEVIEMSSRCI
jgi:hypothetical protein